MQKRISFLKRVSGLLPGVKDAGRTSLEGVFSSSHASFHFLAWVMGFIVYSACLLSGFGLTSERVTANWRLDFGQRVTIMIPPTEKGETREKLRADGETLLARLQGDSLVSSAALLDEAALQNLLEPWLGEGARIDGFALPVMIDVSLTDFSKPALQSFRKNLAGWNPAAVLDTHRLERRHMLQFSLLTQWTAGLIVAVSVVISGISAALSVQNALSAHHETLDVLHLIGASDRDIRRHIVRENFRYAFFGVAGAVGAALFTVFLFFLLPVLLGGRLALELIWPVASVMLGLGILALISAAIAANITVYRRLKSLA